MLVIVPVPYPGKVGEMMLQNGTNLLEELVINEFGDVKLHAGRSMSGIEHLHIRLAVN